MSAKPSIAKDASYDVDSLKLLFPGITYVSYMGKTCGEFWVYGSLPVGAWKGDTNLVFGRGSLEWVVTEKFQVKQIGPDCLPFDTVTLTDWVYLIVKDVAETLVPLFRLSDLKSGKKVAVMRNLTDAMRITPLLGPKAKLFESFVADVRAYLKIVRNELQLRD